MRMRRPISFWLNRPEYLYQPAKLMRRVLSSNSAFEGVKIVRVPWGLPLEVDCSLVLGRILAHHGIFELPVVEAIFRLVNASDLCLDIGANLGYMTCAAVAAGAGRVISFEPHPRIFARLSTNVRIWSELRPEIAERVLVFEKAVSSTTGTAVLRVPIHAFQSNDGVATLESGGGEPDTFESIAVATTTLEEIVSQFGAIGVLKIDIEGHELRAFSACSDSLTAGSIRDIIYEDFGGTRSETSRFLRGFGYTIFGLDKSITGPVLLEHEESSPLFDTVNLIATREPERLRKRMARRGYKCLSTSGCAVRQRS